MSAAVTCANPLDPQTRLADVWIEPGYALAIEPITGQWVIVFRRACPTCALADSSNPRWFAEVTRPLGYQDDGEGGVMFLGNCKTCGTTKSAQVERMKSE